MSGITEQLKTLAQTTLASQQTAGATTLVVTSGSVFPASGQFRVRVDGEIELCTSRSGNTLTVSRGEETTTAAIHQVTDTEGNPTLVTHVLTAGAITNLLQGGGSPVFQAGGLTGATGGSRYVGAVSNGPPTTGTFAVGDYVVDTTLGCMWQCTTAGTPGSWKVSSNPAMYGVAGTVIGGAPSLTAARWLIQAGSTVVTTNGAGGWAISYPSVFPNGVLTTIISDGNDTGGGHLNVILYNLQANQTTSAIQGIARDGNTGGGLNAAIVRINWVALGW